MADFYAPEVVIEMPFAPAGLYPARIETTREELRARFRAGAAARRYRDLRDVVIHETADPGVVIIEYGLEGEMTESAEPFSLRFVMVMTIRGRADRAYPRLRRPDRRRTGHSAGSRSCWLPSPGTSRANGRASSAGGQAS